MKLFLTGSNLDWYDNDEYFQQILKIVWIDHNDDQMSQFVENYTSLLIKKIVGPGSVLVYNPYVLFLNCLSNDNIIDYDLFFKSFSLVLEHYTNDYKNHIDIVTPGSYEKDSKFGDIIVKCLSIYMPENSFYTTPMGDINKKLIVN